MLKDFFSVLSEILLNPILFFSDIKDEDWYQRPVTIAGIASLILSFAVTISIFITTYLPIGATLFEKVNPSRVIFAYPTIVVLGFAFSVITLSIAFSLFLFLNLAVFGTLGWLVYFAGNVISKSHGDFLKHLKASFYLSATSILFVIPILMIILTKNKIIGFTNFRVGYNIIYGLLVIFLYGVEAIISRKMHGLKKWKAFVVALIPLLVLLAFGVGIDKFILPKIQPWII